jgi:DNA-binding NarL/FixJ family response regulator
MLPARRRKSGFTRKEMPTRVLLADDYPHIRDWLRSVLESKGYHVDGEASSGREAVSLALRFRPDVIVMDLQMPCLNGLEAAREILHSLPGTRVIMFTTNADQSHLDEGLRIGIRGFAFKTGQAEELLQAIREVLIGRTYMDPRFSRLSTDGDVPLN